MNKQGNTVGSGWSLTAVLIIAALLLLGFLYQQTIYYLASKWNDIRIGEYAHGYLVLAISIYLIVCNRKRLAKITPSPSYAVLPLIFLASLGWLAAVLVDVQMLQTVGLLGVLFTVIWALTGHQAMRVLAFPVLFIVFAIPIWFPLSPLLQNITADVVFWLIRILKVPAFRQENMISVPFGTFSVEEACSGLRYFLAALTLGSLYAYLNYVTLLGRIAVVLVAAGAALLANILRVFIVVYLGYSTQMQHPWVEDHLMLGWYLFGALVAVLLFIDARFYKHGTVTQGATTESAASEHITEGCIAQDCGVTTSSQKGRLRSFVVAGLSAIIISIAPFFVYQHNNQQALSGPDASVILPQSIKGWSAPLASKNDWLPQYHGAVSTKADYLVDGEDVSLFVAYYSFQKQGIEVINDLNRISNQEIWRTRYSRSNVRRLFVHDVLEQVIENSKNENRLVWYWYNIGGKLTVNKYEAKLLQLTGLLMGQPQAYMVAVSVPVNDDIERSRKVLKNVVNDLKTPLLNLQLTDN